MCECPCGDFQADFRLPGPAGTVYAVQRYVGCDSCHTGPAVVIHRFSVSEARRWHVDELPDLQFMQIDGADFDGAPSHLEVLNPDILKRRMLEWAERNDADEQYDIDGAFQDAVDEVLIDAAFETIRGKARRS